MTLPLLLPGIVLIPDRMGFENGTYKTNTTNGTNGTNGLRPKI